MATLNLFERLFSQRLFIFEQVLLSFSLKVLKVRTRCSLERPSLLKTQTKQNPTEKLNSVGFYSFTFNIFILPAKITHLLSIFSFYLRKSLIYFQFQSSSHYLSATSKIIITVNLFLQLIRHSCNNNIFSIKQEVTDQYT